VDIARCDVPAMTKALRHVSRVVKRALFMTEREYLGSSSMQV
jgi:hypothetical protein